MANENALAVLNKTKLSVLQKIDGYMSQNQLNLPVNYSYGTAINQFQLAIQDDAKIMSCTQNSIAKAMLDMVVLGLSIGKNQCYVIPYGNQARLHVSYEGKAAIAKRIDPTIDTITGRVVRDGEDFDFEDLPNGFSRIIKHKRTLKSMDSDKILAGYATITYKDGKEPISLIYTFDRIKKSWSMSQMRPVNPDGSIKESSTHRKFADDMIVKTMISAITKHVISQSDDSSLFYNTIQAVDIEESAAQAKAEIQEKQSSGPYIDFDTVQDAEYEEVIEHVEKSVEPVEDENGVVTDDDDILWMNQESLL